jgi:two-component system chemotaxis response regulator CheB
MVVMGASAGGVEALSVVVAGLPEKLAAPVLVVQHLAASRDSDLPQILSRRGLLPATHAIHGEPIESSRIYVAPPDNHLTVGRGFLHVARGPKENGFRPSIDALFRSASLNYGPNVIGIVLTGALNCGTAGLLSIKARGGVAIVQDPEDAMYPSMPRSAISHVEVDHIAPLAQIGPLIARLVAETSERRAKSPSHAIREIEGEEASECADIVCPACQGRLSQTRSGKFEYFRCHVGHTFTLEALVREQAEETERALWSAVRALEESAVLSLKLALGLSSKYRQSLDDKANAQLQHAQLIRQVIERGAALHRTDVEAAERSGLD